MLIEGVIVIVYNSVRSHFTDLTHKLRSVPPTDTQNSTCTLSHTHSHTSLLQSWIMGCRFEASCFKVQHITARLNLRDDGALMESGAACSCLQSAPAITRLLLSSLYCFFNYQHSCTFIYFFIFIVWEMQQRETAGGTEHLRVIRNSSFVMFYTYKTSMFLHRSDPRRKSSHTVVFCFHDSLGFHLHVWSLDDCKKSFQSTLHFIPPAFH